MIKTNSIKFSINSMVDDFGRVFFLNDKVYRAINKQKKEYCLSLVNSNLFRELETRGFIPITTIADITIEGYDLILEHERLPETLQHEWTFSMLKDAALTILEINEICSRHGYELKDAHTLNVLFRGSSSPVMIDIGSIEPKNDSTWQAHKEFIGAFLIPLFFWSNNNHLIVRKLLESKFYRMFTIPEQSLEESGLLNLLNIADNPYEFKVLSKTIFSTKNPIKILHILAKVLPWTIQKISKRKISLTSYSRKQGNRISLGKVFPESTLKNTILQLTPPTTHSQWNGYHNQFYNSEGSIQYSNRFLRILELIENTSNIETVIDLAGNEGYFSELLNNRLQLKRITIADYDENAIDSAYIRLKAAKSQTVVPALLNFMFTPDIQGTADRLKSDLAVALAVTHHLILTANFSLPTIFERIRSYSNNYVMIEFMPLGLWSVNDNNEPIVPDWYTLDWFRAEFANYFTILHEEQLEKNRILFFGKINR